MHVSVLASYGQAPTDRLLVPDVWFHDFEKALTKSGSSVSPERNVCASCSGLGISAKKDNVEIVNLLSVVHVS